MLIFKTLQDMKQLHPTEPVYSIVRERISVLPGYIILIEESDIHKPIDVPELKGQLKDLGWEGVWRERGYFHAVYLTNNEFALEFIIPDANWLPESIRVNLEQFLV